MSVTTGVYYRHHEPWRKNAQSYWVTDALGRHWELWRIWDDSNKRMFQLQFVHFDEPEVVVAESFVVSMDPNDSLRKRLDAQVRKYEWMFTDPVAAINTGNSSLQLNIPWEVYGDDK